MARPCRSHPGPQVLVVVEDGLLRRARHFPGTKEAGDPGLAAAEQAAGIKLGDPRRYSFEVYRWGKEIPDPDDMRILFVDMLEQASAYVSGNTVLIRRAGGSWNVDQSMPT